MMRVLSLVFLLVVAAWVRAPYISNDLPYFYNEDEAHHFNRVVNMVKRGTFDPEYFHKPSFHFYLRMPVVAASFLSEVSKGRIRSLKEIITASADGVGGYAFSASHPAMVAWNRLFSVLLSVLTVLLTFMLARTLELSPVVSFCVGLACALSPALIGESAVIGVDVVVVFLATLTSLLSVVSVQSRDGARGLLVAAVVAGLTVSTKYNALPIVLVPMVAALSSSTIGLGGAVVALVISTVSFFLGSPFILKHLDLFLDQFAYEIWHYKIAGHEGHSGTPGISQFLFFMQWFATTAVGWGILGLSALGSLLIFRVSKKAAVTILVFPVVYVWFMSGQRANFTRNMLVMVPFLVILFGVALQWAYERAKVLFLLLAAIGIGGMIPVFSAEVLRPAVAATESRLELGTWIQDQKLQNIAVTSDLQLAPGLLRDKKLTEVPPTLDAAAAQLQGFDYFVTTRSDATKNFTTLHVAGSQEPGARIVRDPKLFVVALNTAPLTSEQKRAMAERSDSSVVTLRRSEDLFTCQSSSEKHCWFQSRIAKVSIPEITSDHAFGGINGFATLELELMSPWAENQQLVASFRDFLADVPLPPLKATGVFEKITVKLPYQELKDEHGFFLTIPKLASPRAEGLSTDDRRLGVAIRSVKVLSQ
jgi:hypothetical protein